MEMWHVVQTFECADYWSVSIQKKLDDSPQLSNGGTLYVLCKQFLVFNLQMKFHGCMSMHMEPLHLFFHVILYTKTNRVQLITHKALTFKPMEDSPWFDHSKNNNKKKLIQQYYHMFWFIIQRNLTFEPMAKILWCLTMQIKPLLSYFPRYYLIFHTHDSKRFKKDLNWCLT